MSSRSLTSQPGPSCFDVLDRHVVAGAADRLALAAGRRSWTYAQLLEEVAAFGGVLRHCGVTPGDRVVVALPEGAEAVVTVLACARIGATHELTRDLADSAVVVTASSESSVAEALRSGAADPAAVVVSRRDGDDWPLSGPHALDRDVLLRAARTDPAPCADDATVTPYDGTIRAWVEPLLAGETLTLP